MFRSFRQWFIPSSQNDYTPHIFRVVPVIIVFLIVVGLFGITQLAERSLLNQSSFAAVIASVLVDLTNGDRANEGLHGLIVNPALEEVARLKAEDMAKNGYFAHTSPDGKTPWYWFQETGYTFSYAGENLAVFFGDSADVERAWMESPAHRANILNSHFTEIGIATAEGYYQGKPTIFVVQVFGTPAVEKPVVTLSAEQVSPETEDVDQVTGVVSGESIQTVTQEDIDSEQQKVTVLLEDTTFIAVKNEEMQSAPSAVPLQLQQAYTWERLIASPYTMLSYLYALLIGIIGIAFVFLIVFESKIQRPKSIFFGVLLLLIIGTLFFFSNSDVAVAAMNVAL